MALPTQPALTANEKAFISRLKMECQCNVTRELDPRQPKKRVNMDEKGWYLLSLDSLPCQVLEKKDSLQHVSYEMARELHTKILTKSFPFPYKNITISFSCITGDSQGTVESFSYDLKTFVPAN